MRFGNKAFRTWYDQVNIVVRLFNQKSVILILCIFNFLYIRFLRIQKSIVNIDNAIRIDPEIILEQIKAR